MTDTKQVLIKEEKLRSIADYDEIFNQYKNGESHAKAIDLRVNRDDDAFTKTDVIEALDKIKECVIVVNMPTFEKQAAIIEAAYDYIQQRLIDAELDMFKLSQD